MSDWKGIAFRHQPSGLVVLKNGKVWEVRTGTSWGCAHLVDGEGFYTQGPRDQFETAAEAVKAAEAFLETGLPIHRGMCDAIHPKHLPEAERRKLMRRAADG